MSTTPDRIADIWGPRTPHEGPGWPVRVDQNLEEEPDRWVQAACFLCSNGCGLDIGVKDDRPGGRMVGVRGKATDVVNRGRLGPKGLYGWVANASTDRLTTPLIRRGDRLEPVVGLPSGQALLLVNPMQPLATGPVFAAWDGVDRGPLGTGDPLAAARAGRNDLEAPATAVLPVIAEVLASLRASAGADLVRMSGSGATCFALFDNIESRDLAARRLASQYPDWWQLPTRLR